MRGRGLFIVVAIGVITAVWVSFVRRTNARVDREAELAAAVNFDAGIVPLPSDGTEVRLTHEFAIPNLADASRSIVKVTPTCQCVVTKWSGAPIGPHEIFHLTASMHLLASKVSSEKIFVQLSDGAIRTLSLRAQGRRETALEVAATRDVADPARIVCALLLRAEPSTSAEPPQPAIEGLDSAAPSFGGWHRVASHSGAPVALWVGTLHIAATPERGERAIHVRCGNILSDRIVLPRILDEL